MPRPKSLITLKPEVSAKRHQATSPVLQIWTAKPLDLGPAGDVVRTRRFVEVLREAFARQPTDRLSTLILTSVCLDLNAQVGDEPYLRDVAAALIDLLQSEPARHRYCCSPLPLVQYAGLELLELDPPSLMALLAPLIVQILLIPQPRFDDETASLLQTAEWSLKH